MRKPLALATLTSFASLAHASYYVVDNPPPAPVSALIRTMPDMSAMQSETQQVTVPFVRRSAGFSRDALRALSNMLDNAQNATRITITACGDAGDSSDSIAYRRAANVKAWLLDNGVDGSVVTTSADGKVMKSPKGFSCVVRLTLGTPARGTPAAYAQLVQSNASNALDQPAPPPVQPQVTAQAERIEQMKMIARVLDMARAKVITGDNAVAMIDQLMRDSDPAASTPKPVAAAIMPAPVTAQITAMPMAYPLTANRTLKETLTDWARTAGWKEPKWTASNPYLIAQGQSLNGDFMGAIRTVSDLVPGLDFRVNTATREITVMDAVH
ncbi:hypothetical protein PWP93_36370 [Paraburkholderia sp. A1RI-2L]|uniref:hypothetical protein n=1 Tax=Paraburkholderia sp. A1RI-2L TaxID=3028367 RepID=UPI003B7BD9F6